MAELRSLRPDEWRVAHEVASAAFQDLERREGVEPHPLPPHHVIEHRYRHIIETDPGGAWVAEENGRAIGAACAILREGVWGLSLLVVDPSAQSGGVGRALLERAVRYGDGARGGIITSSSDPRALRAYARAGFALHPAAEATGVPHRRTLPSTVREGSAADLALTEAIDRKVRGAAHGPDIEVMLAAGSRMLVVDDRGYAFGRGSDVYLVAAADVEAAQDLLRAVIATAPEDDAVTVSWITSAQGWAVDVVLEAGLELKLRGAVFLRGDVGPFQPYLPSGAYL
jgi:GNAT superfamily N-acetyltransferase